MRNRQEDKGPLRKAVTTRTSALEVVGDFNKNYLFRHSAWLFIALVILAHSENQLLVDYPEKVQRIRTLDLPLSPSLILALRLTISF
jgi:hypothetical protein